MLREQFPDKPPFGKLVPSGGSAEHAVTSVGVYLFKFREVELWWHAHAGVDEPLLRDGQDVVGDPVQHQARREEEEHDGEGQRHVPHHFGLQWVWWRWVQRGLQERGQGHD
jgi:hypothetical protein